MNQAKELAYANILNGPDTPGRRFLIEHLEQAYPGKPMLPNMKTVESIRPINVNNARNRNMKALAEKRK